MYMWQHGYIDTFFLDLMDLFGSSACFDMTAYTDGTLDWVGPVADDKYVCGGGTLFSKCLTYGLHIFTTGGYKNRHC